MAAFSTLSLGSCGWRLANVGLNYISSNQSEKLYIYTWTQYTDKELITTFTTQTGVKVIADVYESNDVMLAKLQAGGGGTYSINYPSDYMVQKMAEKGFGLPAVNILNSNLAVLIGMSYSLLPYMVLILYASLEKLDKQLLEAAADLGANPMQTFWKVTVPQVLPGIAAGSLLVFITGLGDFIDPELLGGASSMTAARLVYNQFLGASQNWGFGSALSMVLILMVSIAIAFVIKFDQTK
jgi:ABC-type proline/glycine betaine transport system permease subunit